MIQISQLKLKIPHSEEQLQKKIINLLRIQKTELLSFRILKKSLDARKKPVLFYVYSVEAVVKNEGRLKKKIRDKNILFREPVPPYVCIPSGERRMKTSPVIVGSGPAGLFCAYSLARMGYRPILLERGKRVEERIEDVDKFWKTGMLNPASNVQFGEGGAGTFSDGKLNTLIHDASGRGREVLKIFAEHGASRGILYESKPHIGTDVLMKVIKNMRQSLTEMGADIRFHSQVTDLSFARDGEERRVSTLTVSDTMTGTSYMLPAETVVLAIGHSARDTFAMLKEQEVPMEPKSFAVGVRVEHPQTMINESQYGSGSPGGLPAAPYKLTANLENGRGVYTFCMCPGGYVVNASSEEGKLAVNGMSYSDRSGLNANSAVIVTVTPDDYGIEDILSGVEFQRRLEKEAFEAGKGGIPVQLFKDFCTDTVSGGPGMVYPQMKGCYTWTNVRRIFPEEIAASIEEGIRRFGQKLPGYAREDAVISAVESRTSSPVRILRDDTMQSRVKGLYPCGEGAGYAGGITSAAMDGLKVAESVSQIYRPFDKPGKC
ncbi:FAD-dependent protein [Lachnospiraceae bacterium 50-23]